jgi:glycosyltransferase involved in cell wall biosynthesis
LAQQRVGGTLTGCGVDLTDATYLLGRRDDMPRITAALDVAVSSSFTEAFPNAIGEAMSCGVPCVVTDVGDCGRLVSDTGVVVPPRNPERLATGISQLLDLSCQDRQTLGAAARKRVIEEFSLDKMVKAYMSLYVSIGETRRAEQHA